MLQKHPTGPPDPGGSGNPADKGPQGSGMAQASPPAGGSETSALTANSGAKSGTKSGATSGIKTKKAGAVTSTEIEAAKNAEKQADDQLLAECEKLFGQGSVYDDLLESLELDIDGRFFNIAKPEATVLTVHFGNLMFRHETEVVGQVKVLNTLPCDIAKAIKHVRQNDKVLKTKKFKDFIYVQDLKGYLVPGWYMVREIPSMKVLLQNRDQYEEHLLGEREADALDPNVDETYRITLGILKDAVEMWKNSTEGQHSDLSPYLQKAKAHAKAVYDRVQEEKTLTDQARADSSAISVNCAESVSEHASESAINADEGGSADIIMVEADPPSHLEALAQLAAPTEESVAKFAKQTLARKSYTAQSAQLQPNSVDEQFHHDSMVESAKRKNAEVDKKIADLKRFIKEYEGKKVPIPKSREDLEREELETTRHASTISFMVDRPYEDTPTPHPESLKYASEFLKLKPDLGVCAKCGECDHSSHRCAFETSAEGKNAKAVPSQYEDLITPHKDSLAARGFRGLIRCIYPYCETPDTHRIEACNSLHERCETCRTRGHNNFVQEDIDLDGKTSYISNCPVRRQELAKDGSEVNGPDWTTLQFDFERFANFGTFTKYRKSNPLAGWFPAYSEKDGKIIRAIGYTWLCQSAPVEAFALLTSMSKSMQKMFGCPFQPYSDDDWTLIHRRRMAKRPKKPEAPPRPVKQGPEVETVGDHPSMGAPLAPKQQKVSFQGPPPPKPAVVPSDPPSYAGAVAQLRVPPQTHSSSSVTSGDNKKVTNRQKRRQWLKQKQNQKQKKTSGPAAKSGKAQTEPTPGTSGSMTYSQQRQQVASSVLNIGQVQNHPGAFHLQPPANPVIPPGHCQTPDGKIIPYKPYIPAYPRKQYIKWNKNHDQGFESGYHAKPGHRVVDRPKPKPKVSQPGSEPAGSTFPDDLG